MCYSIFLILLAGRADHASETEAQALYCFEFVECSLKLLLSELKVSVLLDVHA